MCRSANARRFLIGVVLLFVAIPACGQPATRGPRYRIAYATYLGGGRYEQAREVIPSGDGSVLVGGQTHSNDFPVTEGCLQPTYGGEKLARGHGGVVRGDCFLARLSPDGSRILTATYFGGSRQERNTYGLLLDSQGNIVVSSATRSHDLTTTKGAYQPKYGGGQADMYAAKISPDMKRLIWCTYVGASGTDWPRGGIEVDAQDNVYIVGRSDSSDYPTTPGVHRRKVHDRKGDGTIVKLSADGSRLVWNTLLGGSDWDGLVGIRADAQGSVYVIGHTRSRDLPVTLGAAQAKPGAKSDCWAAKLSADASRVIYLTYLAGGRNEFAEHRPYLMKDGSLLVTGVTASADFPTTDGAFQRSLKGKTDGFLTKISPDGRHFVFSTLLGGSGGEFYLMPTPDTDGNIVIVGHTNSTDFPVTPDALQKTYGGGPGDGVLAILSGEGKRLIFATYLGGAGHDLIRGVAVGPKGEVWLVGSTASQNFPVTSGAAQGKMSGTSDAFVVKLVPFER